MDDPNAMDSNNMDPNNMDPIERLIRFSQIASVFGRSVAAYQTAPWISGHALLNRRNIDTPPAEALPCDDALTDRLWQIIETFAKHNIFLTHTDHLSERELYQALVNELLDEPVKDYETVLETNEITQPGFWSCTYDLTEVDGLDDGWVTYLRYYADEHERDIEQRVCPDQDLPEREEPPFDRDRFLPKPIEERLAERGEVPPEEAWFKDSYE